MEQERVAGLLTLYGDDVFRLAMSYLGNRQDAEDICQNVFLKVLNTEHEPLPGKEKAWLDRFRRRCAADRSGSG